MSEILRSERKTQNRVIALFTDKGWPDYHSPELRQYGRHPDLNGPFLEKEVAVVPRQTAGNIL